MLGMDFVALNSIAFLMIYTTSTPVLHELHLKVEMKFLKFMISMAFMKFFTLVDLKSYFSNLLLHIIFFSAERKNNTFNHHVSFPFLVTWQITL